MFPAFSWLLARIGCWPAMLALALITLVYFWLSAMLMRLLGIQVLP